MVFFTINSCFMSFTLKGWWLPHHGHHFLPRKTVLWVSHGMAMQDSDTKSFQFAMHLHSVIVWSSLNIARFITHIFQKLENMHSLPKKHCQKLETTTTPTQKSHQNIFLLILKVFVGVMTLETWPSTHLPFSQRFVFPQNFQLTQGRQLSAVFPKKTGQKSPVTSTVLLPPSWSSFSFGKIAGETWGKLILFQSKKKNSKNCSTKLCGHFCLVKKE